MGGNGGPAAPGDQVEKPVGVKSRCQVLEGAEHEEVAVRGFVLHADDDDQAVVLRTLTQLRADGHRVVIGETHPVEPAAPGMGEDVPCFERAAGGDVGVNVKVEKHAGPL